MRTGSIQLQLEQGDVALGTWWSGRGREATGLLRRYLPELDLTPRDLADLIDGDAVLLVVRVNATALGEVVTEDQVRVRAAHLALTAVPRGRRVTRRRVSRGKKAKFEAA
ncbi:MAG: hypothetical protein KC912_12070 [Proteobacteria bacterium]|nr:hypothetical protein [Pseudomonadota bacterium]